MKKILLLLMVVTILISCGTKGTSSGKQEGGDEVTAKDYLRGMKRWLEPETASEYAFIMYYIEDAENYNKGKIKGFGIVAKGIPVWKV